MDRYPWYSVDSTSWVQIGMFGSILWPTPSGRPRILSMSKQSPATKEHGRSFWSLDSVTQAHVRSVLASEGFDPEDLGTSYGWRDKWNIRFYRRYMETLRPRFVRRQVTFF